MRLKMLVLLVIGFHVGISAASGFNCANSASGVERMVCSDAELSKLDVELNSAYQSALSAASSASKPVLVREQRNWLAYTRNSCDDEGCLKNVYSARIAMLSKNSQWIVNDSPKYETVDGQKRIVVFHRDPNEETSFLSKKLSESGDGRLIECHRLVELPVGYANSNSAYGAYCTMIEKGVKKSVAICADKFVGHFSISDLKKSDEDDSSLIEYTDQNCFGG
jgi:uncharacterized protein YecT (DUF1311 family)